MRPVFRGQSPFFGLGYFSSSLPSRVPGLAKIILVTLTRADSSDEPITSPTLFQWKPPLLRFCSELPSWREQIFTI